MKALMFLFVALLVAGCAPAPTTSDISTGKQVETQRPNSESGVQYVGGDGLPVDERLYRISGEVIADVGSLTRQVTPGRVEVTGYDGYVSSYYVAPTINGKSFIRLKVNAIEPSDTDWVTTGQVVIVKGTDTKMTALLPGDKVDFLCRRQAEAIAAIHPGEWYNAKTNTTWELDYCRMESPVITP